MRILMIWMMMVFSAWAGEQIVFVSEAQNKIGDNIKLLESINADGSNRQRITTPDDELYGVANKVFHHIRNVDISPIGKKLVFRLGWTVSTMNFDRSGLVNLTPYPREWYLPKISPDGKQIAICTDRDNNAEIYLMDYDGGNLRNLTWKPDSAELSPAWSPDGKTIAFITNRNKGVFELWTMDTVGGNQRKLLAMPDGDIREPAWGSNGKIAFALQHPDGSSDVYQVDADGKNVKRLTDGKAWNGMPAWNPECDRIALVSNRSGKSNIWVLNVADGKMVNITGSKDTNEYFPCWVPAQIAASPLEVKAANIAKSELSRPRLLFLKEDIPALKEKFARPPYADVWKAFLIECDRFANPESPQIKSIYANGIDKIKTQGQIGLYDNNPWIRAAYMLAFAYQITGEEKYGKAGAKLFLDASEQYRRYHNRMSFESSIACAYDWLYPMFEKEELVALNVLLCKSTAQFYEHIQKRHVQRDDLHNSNFLTHDIGSFGIAALALAGEKGYSSSWLQTIARLTVINFNSWINSDGVCEEGFSYFNAPVRMATPFLYSLKINRLHPEVFDTNLPKFPRWMAALSYGNMLVNIGDADPIQVTFPPGLLAIYPDNAEIRGLWNMVPRASVPDRTPTGLLWFYPSTGERPEFTGYPTSILYKGSGYAVLRTGYGFNDAMATFTSTTGGHAHFEAGAIFLAAWGRALLADPGQAVDAPENHSQLLIDDTGRLLNYRKAEELSPIVRNQAAAAISTDLVPAFATSAVGTHIDPDYAIPGPGISLQHGRRTLLLVNSPGAPPYYLVRDNVRVDGKEHKYEQIYVGDSDYRAQTVDPSSFVYQPRCQWPVYNYTAGKKGQLKFTFEVPEDGKYFLRIYSKAGGANIVQTIIDGKKCNFRPEYAPARGYCRQWAVGPKQVHQFTKGQHILEVPASSFEIGGFAFIPEKAHAAFHCWMEQLPEGSIELKTADAVVTGDAFVKSMPAEKEPVLLISQLGTTPVAITAEKLGFKTRFYGQRYIEMPRTRVTMNSVDADFTTLLYMHVPGMEMPKINRDRNSAVIKWRNCEDKISWSGGKVTVRRDGKDIFTYNSER